MPQKSTPKLGLANPILSLQLRVFSKQSPTRGTASLGAGSGH